MNALAGWLERHQYVAIWSMAVAVVYIAYNIAETT